ncbi:hypothetical protein L873DRAFT_1799429 [Choiromyces venosus 120613-1]|uniref:Uncharacterized protein n=1 Tax=Choiromyces venosus 120613-1 TaxID=1336337 RepID=A0A3N4K1S8_9PEZI|nr:hypothetical protein L873DRAFT_1799429 [Choiromyces venosus 120613-1]
MRRPQTFLSYPAHSPGHSSRFSSTVLIARNKYCTSYWHEEPEHLSSNLVWALR